ncbi:MAG TPA: sodium:solute symporter [Bacteroidia bacterium]|nr:MAG: Na+/solute symporter [Bacteroidetes bacterium OLB10]MBE7509828.1 sodium:solute symporter [Bacteroidia bacterium]MBX3106210.1 sodium:solute symporter [Bacteroidota bacterium]MCE7954655.1 sodium:solute symporter [Bacteroidetes bacterium CHB6]OQB64784.1 MAG: Sodium/glucose cotransporter [Bacteroidetes bacterium ADurb.Bin141]
MTPALILTVVLIYTILLFGITFYTSRNADNQSYFVGNRASPWYVVAYGMIGASLSGVTFMSVPGDVGTGNFSYFQMVLGYLLGYGVIAFVLLPVYYRMNLTSIYTYLKERLGISTYKTGAFFFILSRVVGASFRLYIVVYVLQLFIFQAWGVPFWLTVLIFILLILAYTFKGGVKTIVWTDSLQTTFMLLSLFLSVYLISDQLNWSFSEVISQITKSSYSDIFVWDWHAGTFFPKHFFGGMFIAIAMTGLDQEMMQKNISCRNVGESQKNMVTFSIILVFVNLVFLSLGALLYLYIQKEGIVIPERTTDDLFPSIALNNLGTLSAICFIIGLISAAYPSADGALTALTASVCIDFLGFEEGKYSEEQKTRIRKRVHVIFGFVLLAVIVIFHAINNQAVIRQIFKAANYTYGPLLGLFAFGILTKRNVLDKMVPVVGILSPIICYVLDVNSKEWFNGYKFGNELIIVNGCITFLGLLLLSRNKKVLS